MAKDLTRDRQLAGHRPAHLSVGRERVILVGGYRPGDLATGEEPLEELERLADTAGANVIAKVVQRMRQINAGTYIGHGKAEEIAELAKREKCRCIIFDHDLTPSQARSLEEVIEGKVVDRTDLILDIFASRARTRMAKVQVNLALAEYRLPRLRRLWTHLEKQEGGIGMRGGAGERQIETDRRMLGKQIRDLKNELEQIQARKERMVRGRQGEHFLVSLVGYTNAGKSTLMRALTGEDVSINDQLFETLDTRTATLKLGGGIQALLSDTVGFIRRLPHHLVASFHATLEEARSADLLLHVVDLSSPLVREQMAAVDEVLRDVGCGGKDVLHVFNKIDQVAGAQEIEAGLLQHEFSGAVSISALRKQGLEKLRAILLERARTCAAPVMLSVFAGDGKALAFIATHFFEEEREADGEWITLRGRATVHVLERLRGFGETVKILDYLPEPKTW
jgi:GTP-binding protein HflX